MISTISRYNFGYKDDDFEGYVFLKDRNYPVAQLHMYGDYYTFFWRGSGYLQQLAQCLGETVRDVSRRRSIPFEKLASGTVSFGLAGAERDFVVFPYELSKSEELYSVTCDTAEREPVKLDDVTFARFDVESGSMRQPIILWADLNNKLESEIGFSTLDELPRPILQLLQSTCRIEITNSELEEMSGQVLKGVFVGA